MGTGVRGTLVGETVNIQISETSEIAETSGESIVKR